MKLLFCDNSLASFLGFRGDVAAHFYALGHSVVVTVPEASCSSEAVARVPAYIKVVPVAMDSNSSNPVRDAAYFRSLLRVICRERPETVFLYTIKPNIYGTLAARMLGIPATAMVAGLGYAFSGNGAKHRLGRALYRFALRRAHRVIALNRPNLELLTRRGFVRPGRGELFEGGEGVNLARYPAVADDYTSVRFLMVARVLYDKGYSEYVEAARIVRRRHPDAVIELLGPLAPYSPMGVPAEIVAADHRSGAITYLGATDNVVAHMGRPGVVVVVVSSYHEGLNRSLMEACSMGRIAITSDIPGCREIVGHGDNGLLVAPKDPEALAAAMETLIALPPDQRRAMAAAAVARARERFDVADVCSRYDAILADMTR